MVRSSQGGPLGKHGKHTDSQKADGAQRQTRSDTGANRQGGERSSSQGGQRGGVRFGNHPMGSSPAAKNTQGTGSSHPVRKFKMPSRGAKADRSFPYHPYKGFDDANDGPVPYADRREEVARLRRKKKRFPRKPVVVIASVLIVLVVAVGATGIAFANSAKEAKADAQTLMTDANQLKNQIVAGDMAGAKETCSQIEQTTMKLHDTTSSGLWTAATYIPFVGGDIQTVRAVSDSAEVLVRNVLVPAMDVIPANGLAGLMSDDGAVNVDVIDDLLTVLSDSAPTITKCAEELNGTPDPVIDQLKAPIAQVKDTMSMLGPIAGYASELKETLPAMLGAEGTRTYLVLACTEAEARSSVGFAGSFGTISVDNGKISMGDFNGRSISPRLDSPVPAATEEDAALFRRVSTLDSADATQITDFKRVGEIEAQIWETNGLGKVDGVIALDTVVLQRMLELTGVSVTTPQGDIVDGSNAAVFLQNSVYKKYENPDDQDLAFALVADAAAKNIFSNMGKVNIANLAKVLKTSAEEGRFVVYMSDETEEAMVEDFGFAGTISSDPAIPETGVYVSACRAGKMYYYLTSDVVVGSGVKNADGSVSYDVTVTFTNTLTPEEVSTLTLHITASDVIYDGAMDFLIYLQAPTGGKISDMSTDGLFYGASGYANNDFAITAGGEDEMNETTYQGNNFWYGWAYAYAGDTITVSYTVTTSTEAEQDLVVRTTPMSGDTKITYR